MPHPVLAIVTPFPPVGRRGMRLRVLRCAVRTLIAGHLVMKLSLLILQPHVAPFKIVSHVLILIVVSSPTVMRAVCLTEKPPLVRVPF